MQTKSSPQITVANRWQHFSRLTPLARSDFAAAVRRCGVPAASGGVLCAVTGHVVAPGHDEADHN